MDNDGQTLVDIHRMLNSGVYEVVSMLRYTDLCCILPDFRPYRRIHMVQSNNSFRASDSKQYRACDDPGREIRREQSVGEIARSLSGHIALEVSKNQERRRNCSILTAGKPKALVLQHPIYY